MSCDSTILKSLNVYLPALEDETIRPATFVRACGEIGRFLGLFGRGLLPIKYMVTSNTQELYKKLKTHLNGEVQDMKQLLLDIAEDDVSICDVVQRLIKCLRFSAEVFEDLGDPCSGEHEDMKDWLKEVYARHLEPIQSPPVARLFYLCVEYCSPPKSVILNKLKEDHENDNEIRRQISQAGRKISKIVADISTISDAWTFTNTYS